MIVLGFLPELRAGISDRDKTAAGIILANDFLGLLKKVLLENIRLEGCPRLARDDEESPARIDFPLERFDLCGISRIEDVEFGKAFNPAERFADYFRAKARAAHAEQQNMREPGVPNFGGKISKAPDCLLLLSDKVQPAQPL